MQPTPTQLEARQLWNIYSTTSDDQQCTAITLPADGVLSFGPNDIVTLTSNVVFQPLCTTVSNDSVLADIPPFYSSSTPQVYVVATATVLAWVLVIMLVISPRNFMLAAGPAMGKGIIAGAHGNTVSPVGVGSRPWLQKAAALTVAVALTIATADTFKVSEQYYPGGIDGDQMRTWVGNSLEIRITRLVSDIFVWLAQVQTLIRLFPRHKEKVIIKWIGFALIVLDTTFSALNSFLDNTSRRPRDFVGAVPAMAYLFELSLSLLYSAWVIYYAFTKRRYAFYHPRMKSNVLIAALSLVSILTPVVFFVTDITLSDVAGWGDYFRWVGAAAASVVVWEWVERIEILERDEKKDGILGREIFDGDEMIETRSLRDPKHNRRRRRPSGSDDADHDTSLGPFRRLNQTLSTRFQRMRRLRNLGPDLAPIELTTSKDTTSISCREDDSSSTSDARSIIQRPAPSATPSSVVYPPSRTDTTSAASTVYVVRQDANADVQPVRRRFATPDNTASPALEVTPEDDSLDNEEASALKSHGIGWHGVANRFKRKRTAPPAEIRAAIQVSGNRKADSTTGATTSTNLRPMQDIRHKFRGIASRGMNRNNSQTSPEIELPWTVIPAPARGTTWSPNGVGNDQSSHESGSPGDETRPG